jgi:4-hydroxy-2-oxoheptanedioate aldolase
VPEKNLLKQRFGEGKVAVGLSSGSGNVSAIEVMARSDIDYIYFDQQHGLVSFDTLVSSLRVMSGTGTTPLVRVLRNEPGLIGQALDAGAEGVIVPMVNSVEEARQAVAGCRYQPLGIRSWGPMRARFGLGTDPEEVNSEVLCLVMIETRGGVDDCERIADEPGVDGVYIGPHDLGVSMGLKPGVAQLHPGPHADAIARVCTAFRKAQKVAGISGVPKEMAERGFNMVTAGSDSGFVQSGLAQVLKQRDEVQ